jgi:hypothetical protein
MQHRRLFCGVLATALTLSACSDAPSPTAPSPDVAGVSLAKGGNTSSPFTVDVTSSVTSITTGTLANGTFTVTDFAVVNGALVAVGTLTGDVLNAAGVLVGSIRQRVTIPITSITGTCEILDLEIGPIDLDLLGLVIHLDAINLEITAQSGPGNLLGNLLCAIAGLLDGGNLNAIAGLLDQLLNLLK